MHIDTYRLLEKRIKDIEQCLATMRWNYVHNAPESKEWGIKSCDDISQILRKHRICNYASLSWEDSMTVDRENAPKEDIGRGPFGATYTGD